MTTPARVVEHQAASSHSQAPAQLPKLEKVGPVKPTDGESAKFEHVTRVPTILPHQQRPVPKTTAEETIPKESAAAPAAKLGLSASRFAPLGTSSTNQFPFTGEAVKFQLISTSSAVKCNSSQPQAVLNSAVDPAPALQPKIQRTTVVPPSVTGPKALFTSKAAISQLAALNGGLQASAYGPARFMERTNWRTDTVKAQKNDVFLGICLLLLDQESRTSPLIMLLKSMDTGDIIFEVFVYMDDLWEMSRQGVITYQAKSDPATTWKLLFQLPAKARGVYGCVKADRFQLVSASKTSRRSAPLVQHADIDKQFAEISMEDETAQLISTSPASERFREVDTRISSLNVTLMSSLEGVDRLVDIDGEDAHVVTEPLQQEEDVVVPSALDDLACMISTDTVQELFINTNRHHGGAFLDLVFSSVGPTSLGYDAPLPDYLSSKPHLDAAEYLVAKFFDTSETYMQLPEGPKQSYLKEMGWKIFGKAIMERVDRVAEEESLQDEQSISESDPAAQSMASLMLPQSALDLTQPTEMRNDVPNPQVVSRTGQANYLLRRNYSVDELLKMRDLAVEVKEELLTRQEMAPSRITNPDFIDGHTRNGRPIVSGNVSNTPRSTPSESSVVASTASWQSFANSRGAVEKPVTSRYIQPVVSSAEGPKSPPVASESFLDRFISSGGSAFASNTNPHVAMKAFLEEQNMENNQPSHTETRPIQPLIPAAKLTPQKAASTENGPRVVEVYKARELVSSTSTSGWKSWAKDTSWEDPAVRAPDLVTPVPVTSTDGWRNFATVLSGTEPEKPIQRTPVDSVAGNAQGQTDLTASTSPAKQSKEPKIALQVPGVSSTTSFASSAQTWPQFPNSELQSSPVAGSLATATAIKQEETVDTKPLPPHLRRPAAKVETVNPVQNTHASSSAPSISNPAPTKASLSVKQENLPPHLRKKRPVAEARFQDQTTQPNKTPEKVNVGSAKPRAENNQVSDVKVAARPNPASSVDPAMRSMIMADLSSSRADVAHTPPQAMGPPAAKQSAASQPSRAVRHNPTNSDVGRLSENLEGLRLSNDSQEHVLDFFPAAPVIDPVVVPAAANRNPMATMDETLRNRPGLAASRWAPLLPQPAPQSAPQPQPQPQARAAGRLNTSSPAENSPSQEYEDRTIQFKNRTQPAFPTPRSSRPYLSSKASSVGAPITQYNGQGTQYTQGGYQVPTAISSQNQTPPAEPAPPAMQTVLVPHPVTGIMIEVTGIVMATPLTASLPSPSYHPASNYENAGFAHNQMTRPSFPLRDGMYNRQVSNESSGSEKPFRPDAPTFSPSRTRDTPATSAPRPPLSPVRVNANVRHHN